MGDYRAKTQPDGSIVIPGEVSAAAGLSGGDGVVVRVEQGEIRIAAAPHEEKQGELPPDPRPIWEIAEEIGRSIPPEEWEKIPKDLATNLDHYLYGAPKRK
jgi:hypothetical protein